jgi:uncharacterized protein with PIN domain
MAELELPETRERRCPVCQSEAITPANHLLAVDDRLIKVTTEEFRCTGCGAAFWIVRTEHASGRSRSGS